MSNKIVVVDSNASIRKSICNIVYEAFPEEVFITETDRLPALFSCLINDRDFQFIIINVDILGDNWKRQARRLQSMCRNTKLIYTTSSLKRHINQELLSMGCFSCIIMHEAEDLFAHALLLNLSGYAYLPYEIVAFKETPTIYKKGKNRKCLLASGKILTGKQFETLEHLAQGLSNKEIASCMNISESTVKLHMSSILKVLGAFNRNDAVRIALQNNIISQPRKFLTLKHPRISRNH